MHYFRWEEIRKSKNHQEIREETGKIAKAVSTQRKEKSKLLQNQEKDSIMP